jgi:hypothetical protein
VKASEKARKWADRWARQAAKMLGVTFEGDVSKLGAMTGKDLTLQLRWHHQRGIVDPSTKNIAAGHHGLKVEEKRTLLRSLIADYNPDTQPSSATVPGRLSENPLEATVSCQVSSQAVADHERAGPRLG